MHFEILSEISDVETFATGSAYEKLRDSDEFTAVAAGASAKASRACD